ncbi:TetR/AcrR family transcriptional regulator [Candidatus Methylobacter oryzae]|uniref:TetR/AcrR family transcriptional regulator n=1 Tax=Candidatus Methylobacter oryzae TaxID=2497749 RepID=A0ABY3CB78_9GAMM|nr:TetR/AcrR family transcriptional regulator [Candidatus Methylobacter oryzae]TRW95881.1 TetR/AcrR family transcriptional regulator [Candidatus Methylobacter oryzae]
MSISERRERDRLKIRTKILDAARELFAAEGYDAVTMRRIADTIEYSATTIYLHFKDKDALIRELCRVDALSLAQAFQSVAAEPEPLERLRKIGMAYVAFGIEHPNHYRLMFMSNRKNDEADLAEMGHGKPETDGYALLLNTCREAIDRQLLAPELTDPDLLAQAFWAATHGVVAIHIALYGDPWIEWRSLEETAELTINAMINGLKR